MGFDLDLAVADPESPFSEEYRADARRALWAVEAALRARGVVLPHPEPLPKRFRYRVGVGSYSTAARRLESVRDFVAYARERGCLPGVAADALDPEGGEARAALLAPLAWAEHALVGHGSILVPAAFDDTFGVTVGGASYEIASLHRAEAALELLCALASLDETSAWRFDGLLPSGGEVPRYAEIDIAYALHDAVTTALRYNVALQGS